MITLNKIKITFTKISTLNSILQCSYLIYRVFGVEPCRKAISIMDIKFIIIVKEIIKKIKNNNNSNKNCFKITLINWLICGKLIWLCTYKMFMYLIWTTIILDYFRVFRTFYVIFTMYTCLHRWRKSENLALNYFHYAVKKIF